MWEVAIPTLNDAGTRNRLHLAGHPGNRKALGYGRPHRGAAGAEDARERAELEPQGTPEVPCGTGRASRRRGRRPQARSSTQGGSATASTRSRHGPDEIKLSVPVANLRCWTVTE
jgi:hypothetical protein